METLPYSFIEQTDLVSVTAEVVFTDGTMMYLCNSYPELRAAIFDGRSFEAHTVQGMQPVETIINPATVSRVTNRSAE